MFHEDVRSVGRFIAFILHYEFVDDVVTAVGARVAFFPVAVLPRGIDREPVGELAWEVISESGFEAIS